MFILILFLCSCSPRLCQFISVQVMPMPFFSVRSITLSSLLLSVFSFSLTVCIFIPRLASRCYCISTSHIYSMPCGPSQERLRVFGTQIFGKLMQNQS